MHSEAQRVMLYDAHKKSTTVAYLLWLFLGQFGAHRFYLDRVGSATVMLVIALLSYITVFIMIGFLGLAVIAIWWIVDAFLIPGMTRDKNMALISRLS